MLCLSPFRPVGSSVVYPCLKCEPCVINKARLWTSRLILEGRLHDESSFVTLTYANGKNPVLELNPGHLKQWFKDLRKAIYPKKVRYYAVGEYGSRTFRPHYHAILFGVGESLAGGSDGQLVTGKQGVVRKTWRHGGSHVGSFNDASCAYVAGYVVEKLDASRQKELRRLRGERIPEFQRMSLRPGIGAGAVVPIARSVESAIASGSLGGSGFVPVSLRYGGSGLPLGRYLRGKLRENLGVSKEEFQKEAYVKAVEGLLELRGVAQMEAEALQVPYQKIMVDKGKQKISNFVGRRRIFRQNRTNV